MHRFLFTSLCLLWFSIDLTASSLRVSTDIGFDANNSTNFLQFAFNSTTEDTIIVDFIDGMEWNTGPLTVGRNDITIILEPGVVLRALPGAFDIFESLLTITDKSDIRLVGYDASIIMNLQEYIDLADSEFRNGIRLGSASNISIEGITVLDSGGDLSLIHI